MDKNLHKNLTNFLFQVASQIQSKARKLAPYKTGNLHNDIKV